MLRAVTIAGGTAVRGPGTGAILSAVVLTTTVAGAVAVVKVPGFTAVTLRAVPTFRFPGAWLISGRFTVAIPVPSIARITITGCHMLRGRCSWGSN